MSEEPNTIDLADERIHAGQTVRTSDGQKLGKVQDRTAAYLMVTGGNIFWAKIYYVPLTSIKSVGRNAILLSVPKTDPSVQEWLTPPLPSAVSDEAPERGHRKDPIRTGQETKRSAGIPSPTIATPVTTATVPESPAPEKPEVRNPSQAHPAERIPVTQDPDEEQVSAAADSTEAPAPARPESTRTQAVRLAPDNKVQTVARADPAHESEPKTNTVTPQATPVEKHVREQPSIPAPPSAAPASRPPVNSSAVDKEIDQRIEELKRKLGISMRSAEKDDATSPVEAANPPVRSAPQRQEPDQAGSPQNEKQSDSGNSRSRAAQIAGDAEAGTFSNARESIKQWTSPNPNDAGNAVRGALRDAQEQVRDWTTPDPDEAEDAATDTLTNARDHVKTWTSPSGEAAERPMPTRPDDPGRPSPPQRPAQGNA